MNAEAERHEGGGGHGGRSVPIASPSPGELQAAARRVLDLAWRDDPAGGFCVPNPTTYPWQWLWDSCFHAVVWAHLGDERALPELASALSAQDADGFVPHIRYPHPPRSHAALWGRPATSSITQPPVYGHALAVLARAGLEPGERLLAQASDGLRFLLERRARTPGGLVTLCHPWESGCDDSPRWDATVPGGWTAARWSDLKGSLVGSIERSASGAPLRNPDFPVGSVGFSALVAWSAWELVSITGDERLDGLATELAEALDCRWEPELATWVDDGPTATSSGRVRTLDALLPLLVSPRAAALQALRDPAAHWAAFGPTGVHRAEPAFEPHVYWRGSAWPQLAYLLWLAATSAGDRAAAGSLASSLVAGAWRSGFAEHWDPATAAPLGAVPQSWSTLAVVVAGS